MLEIITSILPYIATALTAFFGSTILMYKQNKQKAVLENEAFEGEEWKKLYEEETDRVLYWEQKYDNLQLKRDELEGLLNKYRDENAQLGVQLAKSQAECTRLGWLKCEKRGCANRQPPSDVMM